MFTDVCPVSLSKVEGHAAAYKELLVKILAVEAERDKLRSENLVWPRYDNLVTAYGNIVDFGFPGILLLVCIEPAGSTGLYYAAPMPVSVKFVYWLWGAAGSTDLCSGATNAMPAS
jgi:hypothetical protein